MADPKNSALPSPTIIQSMLAHYAALSEQFDRIEGECWDAEKLAMTTDIPHCYSNMTQDNARKLMKEMAGRRERKELKQLDAVRNAALKVAWNAEPTDLVDCLLLADQIAIRVEAIHPEDEERDAARVEVEHMAVSIARFLSGSIPAEARKQFDVWSIMAPEEAEAA